MVEDGFGAIFEDNFVADKRNHIELPPKRFASPVTEDDLLKKVKDAVPSNTRKTTEWCVNTWQEWANWRESSGVGVPPQLDAGISNKELSFWLPCFVVEVCTQKGNFYNGGSLYGLCAGVQ